MSKKLLSVFVVLALVLSMVPVVGLSATKANAATFDNSNLVDADGDATNGMQADCPACGASNVTWTAITAGNRIGDGAAGHYYLPASLTAPDAQFAYVSNRTVCFHLNGQDLSYPGRMVASAGATINIMGNGNVTFTADSSTAANNDEAIYVGNIINIYGGTWKVAEGKTANLAFVSYVNTSYPNRLNITGTAEMLSKIALSNAGTATLAQEANVSELYADQNAKVIVHEGWSGTGMLSTHQNWATTKCTTTGDFTGWLTWDSDGLNSGTVRGRLLNDTNGAVKVGRAEFGGTWHTSLSSAVNAYTEDDFDNGEVITLYCNAGAATLNDDLSYYIDMNGCNITDTVRGEGTVYLLDSANDTYDAAKCGTFITSTATVMGATVGGKRYVTVENGTNYTAHRLDMKITHVTLKTAAAGLYFKAEYKCDATLAGLVDAYGIAVSKDEMPRRLKDAGYSELTDFNPVNNTVTGNSGAVIDILLDDANADNLGRAQTMLYANSYITINGKVLMGNDTEAAYSLETVLQAIDTNWANYAGQADTIKAFYTNWATKGATNISSINFNNINK